MVTENGAIAAGTAGAAATLQAVGSIQYIQHLRAQNPPNKHKGKNKIPCVSFCLRVLRRAEMIRRAFEKGAQDVRLGEQGLDLVFSPLFGGHVLQKHHLPKEKERDTVGRNKRREADSCVACKKTDTRRNK